MIRMEEWAWWIAVSLQVRPLDGIRLVGSGIKYYEMGLQRMN
jgi:hypothetical protein